MNVAIALDFATIFTLERSIGGSDNEDKYTGMEIWSSCMLCFVSLDKVIGKELGVQGFQMENCILTIWTWH